METRRSLASRKRKGKSRLYEVNDGDGDDGYDGDDGGDYNKMMMMMETRQSLDSRKLSHESQLYEVSLCVS